MSNYKILIVEDDLTNMFVLKKILAKDHRISTASNSAEALKLAQKIAFEVVLMDINLGRGSLDGVQVMQEMKKMPNQQRTYFVAVTSFANVEDKARFLKAGFDHYIPKPYMREDILSAIQQAH
ncbi:response regulator [Rapidithrix thailandica]|uniref:Response regulator n=1 Tax=Rapidithrix thailandica TaxID=413964 RepID=A0AAW9S0I9_9BACT